MRALIVCALLLGACGGPHKGKVDPLPKGPKKSGAATAGPAGPAKIPWDDVCPTHFTEDARKAKKSRSKADEHILPANALLDAAAVAKDDQVQVDKTMAAVDEYKKALLEDHYSAEATYQLAVAYAGLWKRGCAIAMLERLSKLGDNERLSGDIEPYLDRVATEPAFQDFKVEAAQAIGR
jgi:hypothetical protein